MKTDAWSFRKKISTWKDPSLEKIDWCRKAARSSGVLADRCPTVRSLIMLRTASVGKVWQVV
jgi:hypothetical protein